MLDNSFDIYECGCGKKVSDNHRFIHGHNWKGKKRLFSEKHKRWLSENMKKIRIGQPPWNKGISYKQIQGDKNPSKKLEVKKKISEALKGRKCPWWEGKHHTAESKMKISEKHKGKVIKEGQKIKLREKMKGRYLGDKHPNWQGGISFEPYLFGFNIQLKEYIRNKYNGIYQLCGLTENGRKSSIHHINYNKHDIREINLIPLCRSCNSIVNKNRIFWETYFENRVKL